MRQRHGRALEGDPAPLAEAIAERLSTIEALPTDDERAMLPTQNIDAAMAGQVIWRLWPPAPRRCSAPIRWLPHSATARPRYARP